MSDEQDEILRLIHRIDQKIDALDLKKISDLNDAIQRIRADVRAMHSDVAAMRFQIRISQI